MCTETTRLLKERISFPADRIVQTFQSRFGPEPWLTPYTDESVERCAEHGIKRLAVVCPGFAADCLETIDEIGNEARHAFQEKGGEELALVPSVNANPAWLDAMATIVTEAISPWLDARPASVACTAERCPASQKLISLGSGR
jgi:ferrochelatase